MTPKYSVQVDRRLALSQHIIRDCFCVTSLTCSRLVPLSYQLLLVGLAGGAQFQLQIKMYCTAAAVCPLAGWRGGWTVARQHHLQLGGAFCNHSEGTPHRSTYAYGVFTPVNNTSPRRKNKYPNPLLPTLISCTSNSIFSTTQHRMGGPSRVSTK